MFFLTRVVYCAVYTHSVQSKFHNIYCEEMANKKKVAVVDVCNMYTKKRRRIKEEKCRDEKKMLKLFTVLLLHSMLCLCSNELIRTWFML